jgi:hypothetical protein
VRGDDLELFSQPADIFRGNAEVIARVVANLESVAVQVSDLIPSQVVALVGREGEAFGDEKRRAEPVPLQHRSSHGVMRSGRVVERQDHELVRDGQSRGQGARGNQGKQRKGEERKHAGRGNRSEAGCGAHAEQGCTRRHSLRALTSR